MSYYLKTVNPEDAEGQLKTTYGMVQEMFHMVPKIFVAQSIRPDLLEPMVTYIKRLLIENHVLTRATKELIAAYVSKQNACAYCVDAHSAMAMAQGFKREEVKSILEDIDGTALIDEKTRLLLHLSEKITRSSYKIREETLKELKDQGLSDEELFEAAAVACLFNYLNRMADTLGAPVEGFQDMMEQVRA